MYAGRPSCPLRNRARGWSYPLSPRRRSGTPREDHATQQGANREREEWNVETYGWPSNQSWPRYTGSNQDNDEREIRGAVKSLPRITIRTSNKRRLS